uniref:Uncharacterized protein MANES_08G068300 n=1 Tax=Rhizophora mucronata TaxID=61149 RepID=A0A2P2INA5_RHIMU
MKIIPREMRGRDCQKLKLCSYRPQRLSCTADQINVNLWTV